MPADSGREPHDVTTLDEGKTGEVGPEGNGSRGGPPDADPAEVADTNEVTDAPAGTDDEPFDQDAEPADAPVEPFDQDATAGPPITSASPSAAGEDTVLPVGAADPPAERVPRRARRAEMKASARRVRRVVRRIDPWSVFKVASIFVLCIWGVVVLASLLVWRAAVTSGSIETTEDFIVDLGFEDFNFNPEQMFEALLSAGAVLAVASVFFLVLLTVLFNLICDLTGGLRVTMIEQDLASEDGERATVDLRDDNDEVSAPSGP